MYVNKFRLIEEVRKRPILWDYKNITVARNAGMCDDLWTEIGQTLHVNVRTCKRAWVKLRMHFCNEANRIRMRIANAKEKGCYKPKEKYYRWVFFDKLRFVADGLSAKAKFDLNFGDDSDSDVEIIENITTDETKSHLFDTNSFQTDSDNDIEIVESDNFGDTQKQKYFENKYESDNDIEIVENANLDQAQCISRNFIENENSPKENDDTSATIPADEFDGSMPIDPNFRSYEVSVSSFCTQDNECSTNLNDNTLMQSNTVFKEEPELQIETEKDLSEYDDINQVQESTSSTLSAAELAASFVDSNLRVPSEEHLKIGIEKFVPIPAAVKNGANDQLEPKEYGANLPSSKDEDYSFLYSFLSQSKVMTQLQKMEFRANMKNLLINIFPASASVNILEKQLLLPEDSDPDRKFLISFWPFINSMSLLQNLQFRAKMADLVAQILSSKSIV